MTVRVGSPPVCESITWILRGFIGVSIKYKADPVNGLIGVAQNRSADKKPSSRWVVHRVIRLGRIKQKQQVSLRYAEIASWQVSGDDLE
jgi:uncharacterized protein (DUF2461 family)